MVPIHLPHRWRFSASDGRGPIAAGLDPVAAYYIFLGLLAISSVVS